MQYTIEQLIFGNKPIAEFYRKAFEHWERVIWQRPDARDVTSLAELLFDEQEWFEENCGGRALGQEIMVLSGIGMLYRTGEGFGREAARARMLYDAFRRSYCSIEVKGIAREVALSYGLLEEVAA